MYYYLSKICYLIAFISLVALTVIAFRTPVTADIVTLRYYAVAALVGVLVGCGFGLKKRIDKKRNKSE